MSGHPCPSSTCCCPEPSFDPCLTGSHQFTYTDTTPDLDPTCGHNTSRLWEWSNGATSILNSPTHDFVNPRQDNGSPHTVCLTVYADNGNKVRVCRDQFPSRCDPNPDLDTNHYSYDGTEAGWGGSGMGFSPTKLDFYSSSGGGTRNANVPDTTTINMSVEGRITTWQNHSVGIFIGGQGGFAHITQVGTSQFLYGGRYVVGYANHNDPEEGPFPIAVGPFASPGDLVGVEVRETGYYAGCPHVPNCLVTYKVNGSVVAQYTSYGTHIATFSSCNILYGVQQSLHNAGGGYSFLEGFTMDVS
jgi:hypothetical protein